MSQKKEVKITFTLPEEFYLGAKQIAESEGVSLTHVLRRAIRTESFLNGEERAGKKILIDDGRTIHRLVRI